MATLYGSLTAPLWGTTDETGIIVDSLKKTTSSQKAELADGTGDIQHVALHGVKSEFQCDFKVKATGHPDSDLVGGLITLSDAELGGTYIVDEVENGKSKADWYGGSMKLSVYPGWTPSTSSTTTTTTGA